MTLLAYASKTVRDIRPWCCAYVLNVRAVHHRGIYAGLCLGYAQTAGFGTIACSLYCRAKFNNYRRQQVPVLTCCNSLKCNVEDNVPALKEG